MYDSGRYLSVTGHHIPNTPTSVNARQDEIASIHGRVFGDAGAAKPLQPSSTPNPLLPDAREIRVRKTWIRHRRQSVIGASTMRQKQEKRQKAQGRKN